MSALLLQTARKSRSLWASSFTRLYAAAAVPEATTSSSVGTGKVDGKVLHPSCVLRRIVRRIARTSSSYYTTSPRVGLSSPVSKHNRSPDERLSSAIAACAAMAKAAGVWRSSLPSLPTRSPTTSTHALKTHLHAARSTRICSRRSMLSEASSTIRPWKWPRPARRSSTRTWATRSSLERSRLPSTGRSRPSSAARASWTTRRLWSSFRRT